ncbi:hypothetical protein M413DRAFT_24864 [Hebeloma cylindrosporum]|uniref:Uncharacterized protein n=1 Tax=Hebeloma cylindrosporum TaxID=76867 RepID=A0A0C2YXP8_HEBCY|nr:hypothetical protein M413DRAFT_24864 [Hebeloma cylindrosporum h7]
MHGVIRFLDTDLLPVSSPEDYPKIIKSGIDEECQHDKSPNITGPDGIATLLHRVGRPQLLERLLDVAGTQEYDPRVCTGEKYLSDVYVTRRGLRVEIGFINMPSFTLVDLYSTTKVTMERRSLSSKNT